MHFHPLNKISSHSCNELCKGIELIKGAAIGVHEKVLLR